MDAIFFVDGRTFPGVGVESLTRSAEIRSRAEYEMLSGVRRRDVLGTYISYTLQLSTLGVDVGEYDELFELLTQPVEVHTVTLPYGQGTKTFDALVYSVSDGMDGIDDNGADWGGLTVQFDAQSPG